MARFWSITAVALSLSALVLPVSAQNWSGGIGLGWAWQDVSGSESSFRSQSNLQPGFVLEELTLDYGNDGAWLNEFSLQAWGFGDAEPTETAHMKLGFAHAIDFSLRYDRRESLLGLAESDIGARSDEWDITRWKGVLSISAWEPLLAELIVRHVSREGTVFKGFYGLNELYPARIELDESMDEMAIRLVTKTLPVRLEFEQRWTNYERMNRRYPAGEEAVSGPDPDLLIDTGTEFTDKHDTPSSSLIASYSSENFEGAASVLWSEAELESSGTGWQSFAIGGGNIGTMEWVDQLVGSAQLDTLAANAYLAQHLGAGWILRLEGSYRDGATDSNLLGQRLFRSGNPTGSQLEFSTPIDDGSTYDYTDTHARLTLEVGGDTWAIWGGGFLTSREVAWQIGNDHDPFAEERDSDGLVVGGRWSPSSGFSGTLEFEQGTFENYIMRTDPKEVDRAVLKLRADLGKGWQFTAHGRHETSSNPEAIASLDHRSTPYGLTLGWTSAGGTAAAGLDLSRMALTTETGIILPDGSGSLSRYDLDLMTATLFGHVESDHVRFVASATRLEDSGGSWPMDAWNGSARLVFSGSGNIDYSAFVNYWSYDEHYASRDDFDVARYGLAIHWSFQ
ncbi:MAG: hypothetical protein GY906_13270 [bacterium]|nr:hypothetical protein [bacterium]